jgi:hypothetical protein
MSPILTAIDLDCRSARRFFDSSAKDFSGTLTRSVSHTI